MSSSEVGKIASILDRIRAGENGTAVKPKTKRRFSWKLLLLIILIPVLLIAGLAVATAVPALAMLPLVKTAQQQANEVVAAAKSQDIVTAQEKLKNLSKTIDQLNSQYKALSFHQYTPFRAYYQDGTHLLKAGQSGVAAGQLMLDTVAPYADVLGLKGQGTFAGGTAEDRLVKILETIDKVAPALSQVNTMLATANQELDTINPNRYPFTYQGKSLSETISTIQQQINVATKLLANYQPLIAALPKLSGTPKSQKYLVIFQNDAELRPTGGFMTAYAIVRVEKGKVFQEASDDIYALDAKFNSKLKLPDALKKYLPLVFNWHLRDMNLSPDYKESMDTFYQYAKTLPMIPKDISGVVAIDTQILTEMIKVLGPVEVPGFGAFSADNDPRCNCPQVIYTLENIASRPLATIKTDRKAFLGPMMQAMIQKAYAAPKQNWPGLFQVFIKSINEKHTLIYSFDPDIQKAVEQANVGGRVVDYPNDYFMVVDSNLGGAKSNLFITEEIEDMITTSGNNVKHDMTLTYKNPAPPSNCNLEAGQLCLNGVYRDYVRFYLPKGAKLGEYLGFEADTVKSYEELGKTVVEGFFKLQPQLQSKLKLSYEVAGVNTSPYSILIQKQPGKKLPKYSLIFNNAQKQDFELAGDKEIKF